MSSAQSLREFISERLTAAAAEIYSEFEKTIVRYEEEIDRQRRLLEINLKPQINLHRIELPQHHVWEKDEVLTDQQLSNHKSTSSLDQKEPEPPQIKEEQQELSIRQHEGQLLLKQTNVTFMMTSPSEETDCHEPEPNRNQPLCQGSTEAENQDEGGWKNENSESNNIDDMTQNKRRQQTEDHRDRDDSQKLKKCKRAHRDERPFSCDVCGKAFGYKCLLTRHMRTHTGDKPFRCETCGKCFTDRTSLTKHIRTHTGEKPFTCGICGKCFTENGSLTKRKRIHTGDKPYSCKTCGKCFTNSSTLIIHMRTHTAEKPYSCKTCGKCFSQRGNMTSHMITQHM